MRRISKYAVSVLLACASMQAVALAQDNVRGADLKRIQDCAQMKADEVDGGESCIFIIARPCTETAAGRSTSGEADCYRREAVAWDMLLNETYDRLRGVLEKNQSRKLWDVQRAWIASRDQTCAFYPVLIDGSMAVPAMSACVNRETARRTLLLLRFLALAGSR